jgi:hypothetical protein
MKVAFINIMKRITAYVNTTTVHWLAEELIAAGVKEMRVIEHFSPTSQISRLQLCCEDDLVGQVREIIRRLGATGSPPDYDIAVSDFDPALPSQIPIGKRMSVLEEPQLARRIRSLFKGASTRLAVVFLAMTLSIGAVGMFTHFQLERYQSAVRESAESVRMVVDAAGVIQVAHLEELLAAERLHRGDGEAAMQDFRAARENLGTAVKTLQESRLINRRAIDSLVEIENRFQSITDEMFGILTRLSNLPAKQKANLRDELSRSHTDIMTSLDLLHRKCVGLLALLEREAGEIALENDAKNNNALNAIRISLTVLATTATIITVIMWIVTRRKVSQPLDMLVEEARALDDGELK